MSVTAADEGMSRTTTISGLDTAASSHTGEELLLKLENALSKMDLAFVMLGGAEDNREAPRASNPTRQSSPLSSPESQSIPPAWVLLEGHSVQGHDQGLGHGVPLLLKHPTERGECSLPSTFTSFGSQTLCCYCDSGPEPARSLFGLLITPTLPSTHTPPMTPRPIRLKNTARASRFFPKPPVEKVSCIPFPPLDATSFGLVQERLCHEPFRLLIAVTFLNKTRGKVALPVCYELFRRYPTPEDLAKADSVELGVQIHQLGLQNQRATRMIKLAQMWVENPPQKGQRYRKLHYPNKDDGKDIKADESISDDDPRVAWEIAHLPGAGAYAIDSWRIFCRDELRGLPTGLPQDLLPEMVEEELRKEWARVLPLDKELRAYLRWRWLRLGWEWNPVTGERQRLEPGLLDKLQNGGISFEGGEHCSVEAVSNAMGRLGSDPPADNQCEGSLLETWREDVFAVRTDEAPKEPLSGDARVAIETLATAKPANADPIDVVNQESVPASKLEDLPKAEINQTQLIKGKEDNREQYKIPGDTASEMSHAIQAALSWLHCEDVEDNPDAARCTVTPKQATDNGEHAAKMDLPGADYPVMQTQQESTTLPVPTELGLVLVPPAIHKPPKGEMTEAQKLKHRLQAAMREVIMAG